MSFWRYIGTAHSIAMEILEEIPIDRDELSAMLQSIGEDAFLEFAGDAEAELLRYIEQTPAQRRKRKDLQARLAPLFVFAAFCFARRASRLLEMSENLREGPGYRTITRRAAAISVDQYREPLFVWPFASDPPFEDWPCVDAEVRAPYSTLVL